MFGTVSALVLLLVVPGPTNTLLLRAGVLFGFAASWRMALIECLAYLLQVSVWGAALFYLDHDGAVGRGCDSLIHMLMQTGMCACGTFVFFHSTQNCLMDRHRFGLP